MIRIDVWSHCKTAMDLRMSSQLTGPVLFYWTLKLISGCSLLWNRNAELEGPQSEAAGTVSSGILWPLAKMLITQAGHPFNTDTRQHGWWSFKCSTMESWSSIPSKGQWFIPVSEEPVMPPLSHIQYPPDEQNSENSPFFTPTQLWISPLEMERPHWGCGFCIHP